MSEEPQTPEQLQTPEQPQPPEPPEPSVPEPPPAPPRRAGLAAALPFIATAAAAVLVSLLAQAMLWPARPSATPTAAPTVTVAAALVPTEAPVELSPTPPPASSPAPTPARGDDGVLALQILDLEEQNRRLWSAVYLLRAASQIGDAITALDGNDMAEADRTILTVYRSLDRAYDYSAEQEKGPIDTFRLELSRIRDDLRVRPDGVDRRLRQLRQLMLSLVDEGD